MKDTSLFISQFLYRIRYWLLWGTYLVFITIEQPKLIRNIRV